jgi:hypothetical protein
MIEKGFNKIFYILNNINDYIEYYHHLIRKLKLIILKIKKVNIQISTNLYNYYEIYLPNKKNRIKIRQDYILMKYFFKFFFSRWF